MTFVDILAFIIIVALLILVSKIFFSSYAGIRLKQVKIGKEFHKNILKEAGASSVIKRIFDLILDFFVFWLVFYFKSGVVLQYLKATLTIVINWIIYILPISRTTLMSISFFGYNFYIVMVLALIAVLAGVIEGKITKIRYGVVVFLLLLFVVTYINLGYALLFAELARIFSFHIVVKVVLSGLFYLTLSFIDLLIFAFIAENVLS